ncbi:TIGR04282 family arsenosugar biosynthesis glycosyltransferase [Actinokineospora sp.]|uniref:TIGR04282 family arsenosugar biosynthesis glycosyltransferase n=1 Tax=Actinokineospora sp. TaxID=1872133 RepID=UPI004037F97E
MTCLLVVAKAPVAGLAKTRLSPPATPAQAAGIAAAALLDTLDAVLATPGVLPVVAMTGALCTAERGPELADLLARCAVFPQRGDGFPERLAAAHADLAARFPGRPVLQIGMDTPQVSPDLLRESVDRLLDPGIDATLGLAEDGGWWALGLRDPARADLLRMVPTSRSDTGVRTLSTLRDNGLQVGQLPELSDVDTMADALRVAAQAPYGRFAHAVAALGTSYTGATR